MKTKLFTGGGLLGLLGVVALVSAFGVAAVCQRCQEEAVADGHMIQMLDRLAEQETIACVLLKMREGDVKGASDMLSARMGDNASAIRQLVVAASDQYRPLAKVLAERPLHSGGAVFPAAMQAQAPPRGKPE